VILTYRVENALTFFEDHDELYWNVTGDEWKCDRAGLGARSSARWRHRPSGGGVHGTYGSHAAAANMEISGERSLCARSAPRFSRRADGSCRLGQGFRARATVPDRIEAFLAANWPIGVPIFIVLPLMSWLGTHADATRDCADHGSVRSTEGLTPGEVGGWPMIPWTCVTSLPRSFTWPPADTWPSKRRTIPRSSAACRARISRSVAQTACRMEHLAPHERP